VTAPTSDVLSHFGNLVHWFVRYLSRLGKSLLLGPPGSQAKPRPSMRWELLRIVEYTASKRHAHRYLVDSLIGTFLMMIY